MSTLVIVEHDNKHINPGVRNVLSAAKALNNSITMLVAGFECQNVAEEAACLEGVKEVIYIDNPLLKHPVAELVSDVIQKVMVDFKALLFSATTFGKNCAPRIAALLDVAQISEVSKIINPQTFCHPIYAGNAIETVQSMDPVLVLTIRTTAFEPVNQTQTACAINSFEMNINPVGTEFLEHQLSQSTRPDLSGAKIVVSGGRGLQSMEKFKLIEELADSMGAAVGASRAAVDAGFVSNDYQVGQTGKIIAPDLYIAIGISGAVQHLAGMKDSKVVVAINKDEDAPIFKIADYALVGDLFELVPEMIEELGKLNK